MKIISDREVELNDFEQWAKTHYDILLDKGYSCVEAQDKLRNAWPCLDLAFFDWLQ